MESHGPFGMSLSLRIFTKLMGVIAVHLRQRTISVFLYLDDWLIKDLIHNWFNISDKILPFSSSGSRFYSEPKEIGINSISEFHVYRHEISDSAKFNQGPNGMSTDSNFDYQINSVMQTSISTDFPFSFGQTQCCSDFVFLGRLHLRPLQNSSPRSSYLDQQHDSISFTVVNEHQSIHNRNIYRPPRSQHIPIYGRQSL